MVVQRRLAAILAADVAGYSRLMGDDEEGTLAALMAHRTELIEPCIAAHRGRVVKTTGDGLLAEFASVVDAVRCAVAFREGMRERNAATPEDRRIEFRIGVNLGDVIVQDDDVFGDGVNVAARLESLGEPNGIVVSGKVHEEVRGKVDVDFEDLGLQEVKNIAEPVPAYRVRTRGDATADAGAPLLLPDKPSIAVLPFENMSGDPEQEYFADGIAEDLITALSRIRQFFVVARNTTFTYKGRAVDVQTVARDLGVRYVLEGSVRKAGNRVRITAQLIDGASGNHLWAERYDRELEDIFSVQDELSLTLAAAITPALGSAELQRAQLKRPENLDVWDLYQRGMWHLNQRNSDDIVAGARLFERAMEMDPNFGPAFAGYAWAYRNDVIHGSGELDAGKAKSAAMHAVSLDRDDPFAHFALGNIYVTERELEAAEEEFQAALNFNPSFAHAYLRMAFTLIGMDRASEALDYLDTCLRLSPRDVVIGICYGGYCLAHLAMNEYGEAVEWGRKSVRQPIVPWISYALFATALAMSSDLDEARHVVAKLRSIRPDINVSYVRDRAAAYIDIEPLLDGLRMAGLPE